MSVSRHHQSFNTVPTVTVHLTGSMGTEPILSLKRSISIDTMISFDGDGDRPFFYCPLNRLIGSLIFVNACTVECGH